MSRIIKSKFYKPFISLLVAVILFFSYEVNKPKAIVPIVIWGASLIAGVVAEELLEMGIKHATGSAKSTKKSKAKRIADEVLGNLDEFDFDDVPTKRRADGSLEIDLSPNDRAKIARKIADEFGDVIDGDVLRGQKKQFYSENEKNIYFEIGNIGTVGSIMAEDMMSRLYEWEFVDYPNSTQDMIRPLSVISGHQPISNQHLDGGTSYVVTGDTTNIITSSHPYRTANTTPWISTKATVLPLPSNNNKSFGTWVMDKDTYNVYVNYLKVKEFGGTLHMGGGLLVPSTLKQVYKIGDDYFGDALPNKTELDKPYVIKNFFPATTSDRDVTWNELEQNYDNDISYESKFNQQYETYLENGDIVNTTNTYNIQTINNYYTDSNYPVKSADIEIEIDIDNDNDVVVPPVDGDDGDDGTGSDLPKQAEVLDRTLISYAKQTYDYLGDSIDGAIVSMKDITDDASGLVDYLDTSFRWLPAEWRALFGSAFILGVFAHFMRR